MPFLGSSGYSIHVIEEEAESGRDSMMDMDNSMDMEDDSCDASSLVSRGTSSVVLLDHHVLLEATGSGGDETYRAYAGPTRPVPVFPLPAFAEASRRSAAAAASVAAAAARGEWASNQTQDYRNIGFNTWSADDSKQARAQIRVDALLQPDVFKMMEMGEETDLESSYAGSLVLSPPSSARGIGFKNVPYGLG